MKLFTIIIPIFNGLEITKVGLKHLKESLNNYASSNTKYKKDNFKIIIVDDGSTDGSSEWIRENYPEVIILIGDGNLWWSGGINMGAKYAINTLKSDYIILWNNDIYPNPDYFINLEANISSHPDKNIFGSLVYIKGTNLVHSFGGFYNRIIGRRKAYSQFNSHEKYRKVDWLPGMGTTVASNIVEEIGYWDADVFPQYMGDSDFIIRANYKKYHSYAFTNLILYNNIDSTGIHSLSDFRSFIRSFSSRKSLYNIKDNVNFLFRHSSSPLTIIGFFEKYTIYTLSFMKKRFTKVLLK